MSVSIERVFSHSGNILRPHRCTLLLKICEQLIYLKANTGESKFVVVGHYRQTDVQCLKVEDMICCSGSLQQDWCAVEDMIH